MGALAKIVGMLVLVFGVYALVVQKSPIQAVQALLTSPDTARTLAAIDAKLDDRPRIHVLFIGDRYTASHNMPNMLEWLSSSALKNKHRLVVKAYVAEEATLAEHWKQGTARQVIASQKWDYVVLQGHGTAPLLDEQVKKESQHYAALFKQDIVKAGGRLVLFVPWAVKPGHAFYTQNPELKDVQSMQTQMTDHYWKLAKNLNTGVVYVGEYWRKLLSSSPSFPLYAQDGYRPGLEGSYLTALVFFRYFSNDNSLEVNYFPKGITRGKKLFLEKVSGK